MKNFQTIKAEAEGRGVKVTLNRPEARNALNRVMISELTSAFEEIHRSEARYLFLQGEGDFFCAGADIQWMRESKNYTYEENYQDAEILVGLFEVILRCPLPVIAVVQGGAFGGALGLIAASDIAIAEGSAKFSFSEVKLGLIPAVVSAFTIPKIGISAARRLFLTSALFSAEEAKAVGLIHQVVSSTGALKEAAAKVADEILAGGPRAIRETKRLLLDEYAPLSERRVKNCVDAIAASRVGEEAQEGLSAFLEKRPPRWKK